MSSVGHYLQALIHLKIFVGLAVERQHLRVSATDDQECWRLYHSQCGAGQVWSAPTRDDGPYARFAGRCYQRCCGSKGSPRGAVPAVPRRPSRAPVETLHDRFRCRDWHRDNGSLRSQLSQTADGGAHHRARGSFHHGLSPASACSLGMGLVSGREDPCLTDLGA